MKLLGSWAASGWLLRLGWAEPEDAARRGELSTGEQQRVAALVRMEDRAAYVAAHLIARDCATAFLELSGAASEPGRSVELGEWRQHCPTCAGGRGRLHGRPSFSAHPELSVSLAHSGRAVAALVSTTSCGVDLELDRDVVAGARMLPDEELAWLAQSPTPQRDLLRLWCRKEALFKASGAAELASISTLGPAGPLDVVAGRRLVEFDWPDGVLVAALGEPGAAEPAG